VTTIRRDGADLLLYCKVQPGARLNAFVGARSGELIIKLNAPPVDGKANDALRRFVAQVFDVGSNRIVIERGQFGRHKTLRVVGVSDVPQVLAEIAAAKQ
jgi:uncharacterized protein (TIGR00251 family)